MPRPILSRRRAIQIGLAGAATAIPAHAHQSASTVATPSLNLAEILPPMIEEILSALLIPGAVVLARTPGSEFLQAFGTRVIGEEIPVTASDTFRIGSNTKTMTGTVALQLVDEGLLDLDEPVGTYWPDTPNGEAILVSQLMDMSSGLYNYTESLPFNQVLDDEPDRAWEPTELLEIGFGEPPYFAPGEGFHYSNTNTVLLGVIIQKLTGQPLETVFEERLFKPHGITGIALPAIDDATLPDPHPLGYLYGTNASTVKTMALPEADQAAAFAGDLLPNDMTELNPSWAWAAGGAHAPAPQLADYAKTLVVGGFLSPETQAQRLASLKPIGDSPDAASYGLALAKFGPMIGHDGSCPGYQSFMGHDPEANVTLIVMTNLQNSPDGQMPANVITKKVIGVLYGA